MYLSCVSLLVDCTGSGCGVSISSFQIAVMWFMVDEKCSGWLYELAVEMEAKGSVVEEDEEGK